MAEMSVREWLAQRLSEGCAAGDVFAWAERTGRAQNTVLIQARKLGWKYVKDTGTFTFVGVPEDAPVPRAAPEVVKRVTGRGTRTGFDYLRGVDVQHTLAEWGELLGKAVRTVRAGADVLLMQQTPEGQRVAYEVHDY
jgi:hypothetical protein